MEHQRCLRCSAWQKPFPLDLSPKFLPTFWSGNLPGDNRTGKSVKNKNSKGRAHAASRKQQQDHTRKARAELQKKKKQKHTLPTDADELFLDHEDLAVEFQRSVDRYGKTQDYVEYKEADGMIDTLLEVLLDQSEHRGHPEFQKTMETIKKQRKKQLFHLHKNKDKFVEREKDFFMVVAHGRFPKLGEPCGGVTFDNNAKFFFRVPPRVRLFYATLGQGCYALGNSDSERIFWRELAAARGSLFLQPTKMQKNKAVRELLENTLLFTEGDLFPNFINNFDRRDPCDVFSVISYPKKKDTLFLTSNGWCFSDSDSTIKSKFPNGMSNENDVNFLISYTLSELVDFLNKAPSRAEGQVLDIFLWCCNGQFECSENKTLEDKVRRQWERLMQEGRLEMKNERLHPRAPVTRSQSLKKGYVSLPPKSEERAQGRGEDSLFQFSTQECEDCPYRKPGLTKRDDLFTAHGCVCVNSKKSCKNGKCEVEPALCYGRKWDECAQDATSEPETSPWWSPSSWLSNSREQNEAESSEE